MADGRVIDNDDVVSGIVLRKDAEADTALKSIHEKVAELNDHIESRSVYEPTNSE